MMNSSVALTVLLERLIVAVDEALVLESRYWSSYDGSRNCSGVASYKEAIRFLRSCFFNHVVKLGGIGFELPSIVARSD
jgi:hypothetical protein